MVAEHDGKRTIRWNGTLKAMAVVFGLLTIGFALVSAITGRSLLGWIGVVGWPSVVARLILAGLIVGWVLRRALLRPGEPAGPRTPRGTLILSPRHPRAGEILISCWPESSWWRCCGH